MIAVSENVVSSEYQVPRRLKPFAEKLRFVAGYRFSDTVSSLEFDAPLGAGLQQTTFSANRKAV